LNSEDLMRKVTAAFAQSDMQPLLNALHDDVVWKSASRLPGPLSFQGDYRKRAGVLELLATIAHDYTFHHITPKEIVGAADTVWGLFDVALCFDPKGKHRTTKPVQMEMAFHWWLKDGKIIEHQSFFDTAYLAARQAA
jgi:ketosteroid isomerase-like protein